MKNTKKIISCILCIIGLFLIAFAIITVMLQHTKNRLEKAALDAFRSEIEKVSEVIADETKEDPSSEIVEGIPSDSADASLLTASNEILEVESTTEEAEDETAIDVLPLSICNPYEDAFLANSDMAGWLQIPDTVIDYPIMWTPTDENYYLNRDFEKKQNKNGCLILDTDSSVNPMTTNLIIHGHNMKSGAMFGTLTNYEKKDYYDTHKELYLYTPDGRHVYEVISVFRSQVYKKSDQVFKFYKFFQADTAEEFDDFYNNIKKMSLYDTAVEASFGDRFITLSTCAYHVENGRFVVVAKEIGVDELYLPMEE